MTGLFLLLLACAPADPADEGPAPTGRVFASSGDLPEMSPMALLFRASLDLRGVRPSLAEIEAVEADPGLVDEELASFLDDERLGDRVRDLYAEPFLTLRDRWDISYGLDDPDEQRLIRSVGEEPLRVLSRVVTEDLPYTELVTGDWTMANDALAAHWPLDYPAETTGWQVARYTDGRPSAGVLSGNALYWRYGSTDSNANRGRANAVSRIFLCNDYRERSIPFDLDLDLTSRAVVEDAVRTNPSCYACHSTLDPLAAHFWGFYYDNVRSERETATYHAEREDRWAEYTGVSPGYFGQTSGSLTELGQHLAADPRFVTCAVQTAFELLLQRETTLDDTEALAGYREVFLGADLEMRPLIAAILDGPEYRGGPTESERATPLKLPSPRLLASQIEDLTGFAWEYGCAGTAAAESDPADLGWCSMMENDREGLRTLAGGLDGHTVLKPATQPIATLTLAHERLAEGAAYAVVAHDQDNPEEARLFTRVDFTELPDTDRAAMAAQLQDLHLRLYGDRVAADGPEISAELALWSELYAIEPDISGAWAGLLSAMLRDPRFLYY